MHLTPPWIRLHGFLPGFLVAVPMFNAVAADARAGGNEGMAQGVQFALDSGEKFGWDRIGNHLLLALAVALVLLWPIARMIVGPQRIFIRAILFVVSMIALTAAFLALGLFAIRSGSILFMSGVAVAFSLIVLSQTRHLFAASHGAAAGVLGCFTVLVAVASYSTEMLTGAMPWSTFAFKSKEEQQRLFADWRAQNQALGTRPSSVATSATTPTPGIAPAASASSARPDTGDITAAPSAPAQPQRPGPNLDALYAQLQKTRAELDMNDAQAVARFNEQAAAYAQERALVAATAAPRGLPVKADLSVTRETSGQTAAGAKPRK